MSYSAHRLELDKARKYIYIRISGRNSKILKYYIMHNGDFSNGQPCNNAKCTLLNKSEQNQFLKIYKEMFPNVVIDIDKYSGVDQRQEGACSFVAFLNLTNLLLFKKNKRFSYKSKFLTIEKSLSSFFSNFSIFSFFKF